MIKNSKSSAKVVWTYGAITGLCVGILWGVYQLVGPVLDILPMTFTIVAFLFVGMLATKRTNRVLTGTLAGLVAGLISGIIFCPVVVGLARFNLYSLAGIFSWMLVFGIGMGMLGGQIVQMINAPTGSMKIVWIYGLIGGICLNIIWLVALYPLGFLGYIGSTLAIVLMMVAFLLVGVLASKQTGRVRTGTQVGLVAGLTGGSIMCVAIVLVSLINGSITIHMLLKGLLDASVLMALAIAEAALVVFLLSLGTGLGSLGGLIGKRKAKVPPVGDPMYSPYPLLQQIIQQQ